MKKHNYGLIIGLLLITIIMVAPIDVFVALALQTKEKVEVTKEVIESLTATTKAATTLMVAMAALIFYQMTKK